MAHMSSYVPLSTWMTLCGILTAGDEGNCMNQPEVDGRHRDTAPPNAGEIWQKRGDALNKNLPRPSAGFRPTQS